MKKVYKEPKMAVKIFVCEHILTSSGVTANNAVKNTMIQTHDIELDNIITFNF